MISIQVGAKLPLTLQVYDKREDLIIDAILSDKYGVQYFKVKLKHIINGMYANYDVEMPDTSFIIAQYFVQNSDVYEVTSDVFKSTPKPDPEEKYLVGEVVNMIKSNIENDVLIGEVI